MFNDIAYEHDEHMKYLIHQQPQMILLQIHVYLVVLAHSSSALVVSKYLLINEIINPADILSNITNMYIILDNTT